ncbi:MAG: hypothetical protein ABFD92_04070 [Planctomycetaceae bacterium]|nr:hypothetical protein [Planctomycetaceae bacterium]
MGKAIVLVVAAVPLFICIRIEVYNHRAGGYLPRQDDEGKWRVTSPVIYRKSLEDRFRYEGRQAGKPAELTEQQKAQIDRLMAEAEPRIHENASFRGFVETWGLAQYAIGPLALCLLMIPLLGRKSSARLRIISAALVVSVAACVAMMFYRGYYSSLGW